MGLRGRQDREEKPHPPEHAAASPRRSQSFLCGSSGLDDNGGETPGRGGTMPGQRHQKHALSSPNPPGSVPGTTASSFPVEALTPCFRVTLPLWNLRVAWDATGRKTFGLDHALSLWPLAPRSLLPATSLAFQWLGWFWFKSCWIPSSLQLDSND